MHDIQQEVPWRELEMSVHDAVRRELNMSRTQREVYDKAARELGEQATVSGILSVFAAEYPLVKDLFAEDECDERVVMCFTLDKGSMTIVTNEIQVPLPNGGLDSETYVAIVRGDELLTEAEYPDTHYMVRNYFLPMCYGIPPKMPPRFEV